VGGGTDLFVQKPEAMVTATIQSFFDRADMKGIREEQDHVWVGASATAQDLRSSPLMNQFFPEMKAYMKLVSSTPIRNMGTVAGNFVNASPIGDLTILFLALGGDLQLKDSQGGSRQLPLELFYKGYKELDLRPGEWVGAITFPKPNTHTRVHFEKVSKRTHLDIASVNSAIRIQVENGLLQSARVSAGGVAPTPLFLAKTSQFLVGKAITQETVDVAAKMAMDEAAPISDARGSAEYKRLLLRQLIYAHFITLFPNVIALEALV